MVILGDRTEILLDVAVLAGGRFPGERDLDGQAATVPGVRDDRRTVRGADGADDGQAKAVAVVMVHAPSLVAVLISTFPPTSSWLCVRLGRCRSTGHRPARFPADCS